MTETSYLGLKKPSPQDFYDVEDQWNYNSDLIDQYAAGLSGEGGVLPQMQSAIAALAGGVHLKGAVDYYTDLPATGQSEGDAYTVLYSGTSGTDPLGVEYAWATYNNTAQWIPLGEDPTYYAKAADLNAEATARQNADTKQTDALAYIIDNGPKNVANWTASTETITDVTFTINADRTVTTTASGAAAARRQKALSFTVPASLPAGTYVLSGCPAGGASGTTIYYCLYIWDNTSNSRVSSNDTGSGMEFEWTPNPAHSYNITIDIRSGTNPNGLTFKPMICAKKAYAISDAYKPYVPSNAELWAMIQAQT